LVSQVNRFLQMPGLNERLSVTDQRETAAWHSFESLLIVRKACFIVQIYAFAPGEIIIGTSPGRMPALSVFTHSFQSLQVLDIQIIIARQEEQTFMVGVCLVGGRIMPEFIKSQRDVGVEHLRSVANVSQRFESGELLVGLGTRS